MRSSLALELDAIDRALVDVATNGRIVTDAAGRIQCGADGKPLRTTPSSIDLKLLMNWALRRGAVTRTGDLPRDLLGLARLHGADL